MHHEFEYVAPRTRAELLSTLKKFGARGKLLAGGTDLLVDIRVGHNVPETVIDVKYIDEYRKIRWDAKEGLSIGATVTCVELMNDKTVRAKFSLLADAAGHIGSPQLRNRATIAGNLCTASPCADMGCSLLAYGASIELASEKKTRVIPLVEFFTGVKKTQRQPDEVVQRIIVPAAMAGARGAMEKLKRIKGHDLAVVSVAMVKTAKTLRVGIGSCAPTPIALKELPASASVKTVVDEALKTVKPIDDIRASKEYRLAMVQSFVEKLMATLK